MPESADGNKPDDKRPKTNWLTAAVVAGVVLAITSGVAGGIATVSTAAGRKMLQLAVGRVELVVPDEHKVISQTGASTALEKANLGDHDMCAITWIQVQSKDGNVECSVSHVGRAWSLNSHRESPGNGAQIQCGAECMDIK